jgi:hypothetical protein
VTRRIFEREGATVFAAAQRRKLKSTTQLASFIGQDMVNGDKMGTNASLDNLVIWLGKRFSP